MLPWLCYDLNIALISNELLLFTASVVATVANLSETRRTVVGLKPYTNYTVTVTLTLNFQLALTSASIIARTKESGTQSI